MWHRPPQLIWKVIEWVMDRRLEVIALHDSDSDSLHGCRNGRGTGTAVILLGKSETGGGSIASKQRPTNSYVYLQGDFITQAEIFSLCV